MNSVTIHQRNLQSLTIEIFKVYNNIAPEITRNVFESKNRHVIFEEISVCNVEMEILLCMAQKQMPPSEHKFGI